MQSSDDISSPTFTIQQIYRAKDLELHHFDFYRLDSAGIVADQLAESLDDPKAVTIVEWGQTVADVLPKDRFIIELKMTAKSPDEREVTIKYPPNGADLIEKVRSEWGSKP